MCIYMQGFEPNTCYVKVDGSIAFDLSKIPETDDEYY